MSPPGVRVRARDLSGRRPKVNGFWTIAPRPAINENFIELRLCNKFIFCIVNWKLISAFVYQDCQLCRYFRSCVRDRNGVWVWSVRPSASSTRSCVRFFTTSWNWRWLYTRGNLSDKYHFEAYCLFCNLRLCSLMMFAGVSDEHAASIFRWIWFFTDIES